MLSEKYCRSFDLDRILLRFYNTTSQKINRVMDGECFIVIQTLSQQIALQLNWCLLDSNKFSLYCKNDKKKTEMFARCILQNIPFKTKRVLKKKDISGLL